MVSARSQLVVLVLAVIIILLVVERNLKIHSRPGKSNEVRVTLKITTPKMITSKIITPRITTPRKITSKIITPKKITPKKGKDKSSAVSSPKAKPTPKPRDLGGLNPFVLRAMDGSQSESWPEKSLRDFPPQVYPSTVHYLWCGEAAAKFRFKDYLAVLSAITVLQPIKFVFHYRHLPVEDVYNSWFSILSKSPPSLTLQKLPAKNTPCGSREMLDIALDLLATTGGVFLGQGVMLTSAPKQWHKQNLTVHFSNSSTTTQGVVFARGQVLKDKATRQTLVKEVETFTTGNVSRESRTLDKEASTRVSHHVREVVSASQACVSVETYDASPDQDVVCISLNTSFLFPKDIMFGKNRFSQLARWLFYGKPEPVVVQKDPHHLIPRISHFIKLNGAGDYRPELIFNHFLNILSALYVGGFEHVFLHGNVPPKGKWWEELQKENVTFLHVDSVETVYNQPVNNVAHKTDVLRFQILYRYGGAYQDMGVVWTSRVNDSLLACPFVLSPDWPKEGEYPDLANNGVMLSRPRSRWLTLYMETLKDYRDKEWSYNSGLVTYKLLEFYPELVCFAHHLQVMCFQGICHPLWEEDYMREKFDKRGTMPWKLEETHAVHYTHPLKRAPSLASLQAVRAGNDSYARLGREILTRSGRAYLLQ